MHYYNPLDKFYKSITGAVPENTEITFRVNISSDTCHLVLNKDGTGDYKYLPMIKMGDYFELNVSFESGLYWYYFDLDYGKFIGISDGLVGEYTENPSVFQLSVYKSFFSTPDWLKGGVIYQIFPDRFCRATQNKVLPEGKILRSDWGGIPHFEPNEDGKVLNNDFFGGDFLGIISKLDYLKSLGVTAIYLNPIFKAYSNHRYDTSDYLSVDELLGDFDDFKSLISKADEYGIKIILDGVFNHTGDDSVYFNKYGRFNSVGAYQSKDSDFYKWYKFINYPDIYESWWGITTLPALNKHNKDLLNFITGEDGVIEKYTKLGVGGWRLDVVDELHSDFVKKIRSAVKRNNKDAVVIGEVWEDASNKISYGVRREYFLGGELDSVMNYPLKSAILNFTIYGDSKGLSQTIKEQVDHYPKCALNSLMNILSTHDTFRLISALSGISVIGKTKADLSEIKIEGERYRSAVHKLKIASLLQYTLPGVPSLYYGDEAGLQGFTDPLNRGCFPWGFEDKEIVEWYKFLGCLRRNFSAFTEGDFVEIYSNKGGFVFKRVDDNSEILIGINLGEIDLHVNFSGELTSLINGQKYTNQIVLLKNKLDIFINEGVKNEGETNTY